MQDWPKTYFRRVQNQLAEQPNSRNNVLRLWYADGFLNVFRGRERYGKLWKAMERRVGTGGTEEKNAWVTIDLQ